MNKFLVGGAVRDTLMGNEPKDRDYVVIEETPEGMTQRGFKQVGADFPVFLSPFTKEEYALARTEKKNGTGYQGFSTEWKEVSLADDLKRRDFTMNSIAFDEEYQKLIDPFNGKEDIKNKIIKHTSEAFVEDPLRVLRAARFKARFGDEWTIHTSTIELMKETVSSKELEYVSGERILAELMKVDEDYHEFFKILGELGAMEQILPGVDYKDWDNIIVRGETDMFIQLTCGMPEKNVDILAKRLKPTTLSIRATKWMNKYWITGSIPEDEIDHYQELKEADVFRQDTPLFNLLNYHTEGYLGKWKNYLLDYPKEFIYLYKGIELGEAIKEWREEIIKQEVGDGINWLDSKWTNPFLEYPEEIK